MNVELFNRNQPFITKKEQKILTKQKVCFIGCGLASQAALLIARTGIGKIVLCDGDKVELSNLNRQAFDIGDIGENKAESLMRKILSINSNIEVEQYPVFLKKSIISNVIKDSDIVVSTVDAGPLYFEIQEYINKKGIMGIFPMNIAFGSLVFVSKNGKGDFKSLFGEKLPENNSEFFYQLYNKLKQNVPSYLSPHIEILLSGFKTNSPIPQLGLTTLLTASLITEIILAGNRAEQLLLTPRFYYFDIREFVRNG
ncbi:MAG: ThiF family adenylyltransferase [Candidatus Nomurabacteria bacterium]|nr:MAG: ThiF family adenylyltransferase [Candidatus Nomurabacteria bacterium]